MKFFGRSKWYKCKMLLLTIVLLHVLQALWFYLHDEKKAGPGTNQQLAYKQTNIAMENLRHNIERAHAQRSNETAKSLIEQAGKAIIETLEKKIPVHEKNLTVQEKKVPVQEKKIPVQEKKIPGSVEGCLPIQPFNEISPNTISTFDIPEVANYTLDERGRYFLPRMNKSRGAVGGSDDVVHVTLIPFSHSDPGYGMTMEGYYQSSTKNVLDLMVDKLSMYKNMTFQWAETIFLERWFRDITPARKEQVKSLIKGGQFEVVLGGWVMPDEAVTRYGIVVDQLIEGHHWVTENLGAVPENAWINDPFGYSSTMPYLWKASGMENMVILRIHQAVKAHLMSKNSMEFQWRPYWKRTDESDILCNLMPYEGYWNSDVCGPKQDVCKLFNFLHLERMDSGARAVGPTNVEKLAKALYEQYKFTSSLYKYNNLVMFLGEDNSYNSAGSWDATYQNYEYLMNHINKNTEMKMHIEFGTLKTYFERLRKTEKIASSKEKENSGAFPVLSGDFFPYSDWENAYWTGYYTTRPWLKKFSRELESVMRSADLFTVLAHKFCRVSEKCPKDVIINVFKSIHTDLRNARRELGMYQHHDGITGTSLPFVVDDYVQRLTSGYKSAYNALRLSLATILTKGGASNSDILLFDSSRVDPRTWVQSKGFSFKTDTLLIVVANPLERTRTEVVDIRLPSKTLSITAADKPDINIPYQVTTSVSSVGAPVYDISFVVKVRPLMIQTFVVKKTAEGVLMTSVEEKQIHRLLNQSIVIENANLKVTFDGTSGMLDTLIDKMGKTTNLNAEFLRYKSKTSGAYLFGPEGPAVPMAELKRTPLILVTKGPMFSEVKVEYDSGFVQTVRLYNTSGAQGEAVHIQTKVNLNLSPALSNSEIIYRFKTDVKSGQIFFTDQNGYQFLGRKTYPKRLIESNFYPVTTQAFVEDETKRLSVHVAQPHGVASLERGWLEFMLDRNMFNDDKRGLGMGVPDKVLTVSDFILQVEYKTSTTQIAREMRYNYPTISNIVTNDYLQNPLNVFAAEKEDMFSPVFEGLTATIPCDISIVGLRHLLTNDLVINGTSLVLHRKSYSCLYPGANDACAASDTKLTFGSLNVTLSPAAGTHGKLLETTLSHLHVKREVNFTEDIKPNVQELRSFLLKT